MMSEPEVLAPTCGCSFIARCADCKKCCECCPCDPAAELRPVQSFFVDEEPAPYARPAPLTGGPDCPCADDPYGCDGACVGA